MTAADPGMAVLAAILPGRTDLLEQAMRRLRPVHFAGQVNQNLFAYLGRYLDLTGEISTRAALEHWLESQKAPAGTSQMYLETFDYLCAGEVSDGQFHWAVERLREIASEQATGEALAGGYEILTKGIDRKGERVVGPEAARSFVLEQFAAIDAELNQADAPEGEVNAEEDQILARYAHSENMQQVSGGSPGITLGITPIDELLGGGLNRGELALFVGFSSSGKTSLCVQAAWHAKVIQGKNVVIFTSETLRPQVINKLIARHSRHEAFSQELPDGLDSSRIRAGTLSGAQVAQFQHVVHDFTTGPYGRCYIAQLPFGAQIGTVRSRLERIGKLFSVDLVIIDYLGLLRSDTRRDAMHEETAQTLKDAKAIAATFGNGLGAPVVSPWQVNRLGRDRALKEGSYAGVDVAGSQEAFNTPDVVLTLLEPAKIENFRAAPVKAELLKNRDGARSVPIQLKIDYATCWFRAEDDRERRPLDPAYGADSIDSIIGRKA